MKASLAQTWDYLLLFFYYLGIVAVLAADIELTSTSSPIRELHSQELSSSGTLGGQQSTLSDLLKKTKKQLALVKVA